jgi:nucleoside-diphosphate-sugar epimerase
LPSRRAWSDIVISNKTERIFVTGGTGRTGVHLVRALVDRGYPVRAVTSGKPPAQRGVEWRTMDWHQDINFDAMVEGCSAVLHLGAELSSRKTNLS